jgi:hypothetical protein
MQTQTTVENIKVECPCCHGQMKLLAFDPDGSNPANLICCHCQDHGVVGAEDHVVIENDFLISVPTSLKRNEMLPAEKREHLRSLGIKDNADIEKIISEIYPR